MKLPNVLYATVIEPGNGGSPYLTAQSVEVDVMDHDGPIVVGTYKLVSTRKLVKQAVEVKSTRRQRRK